MEKINCKYLIVGGGMTADSAARGIREKDPEGGVCMVSNDSDPPYYRPPLSKSLWTGDEELENLDIDTKSIENIEILLNRTITNINKDQKEATDDQGNEYTYEKLLLATGGTPKTLPIKTDADIIYYRTLSDYKNLKEQVDKYNSFGVIGGGFIGSEIVAAIKMYKPTAEITIIFPESGIGALVFPKALSDFLNDYYAEKGIKVLAGELVKNVRKEGEKIVIGTDSGKTLRFDTVVAGLGITPKVGLAKKAGLKVENGITVDDQLRTSDADIYAAGDVAFFYNPIIDSYIRVEHEDNTYAMGERAGLNMAGEEESYDYLPIFYSDLFDYGYEAVGILNAKLKIVEDWKTPYEEGVVYYLENGKVKGVLLWNVWEQTEAAKELMSQPGPFSAESLKGKI